MVANVKVLGEQLTRNVPFLIRFITLALLGGGLIGGLSNLFLMPGFWPWNMPDLAYRFLAGAAAAYVVGSLITFTRSRWVESELLMTTVLIYGFGLVIGILAQMNLIDWSKPVAWAFVLIVSFAVVAALPYVWSKRTTIQHDHTQALSPLARNYLLVLGIVAMVVGVLVWAFPKEVGFIWPWSALSAWKLLDSRLIASMLLTVGGGCLLTWWRNDRGAMGVILPMLWAYCLVAGIGIALHAAITPAFVAQDITYIIIFSVITLSSAALYLRERNLGSQK